MIKKYFTVYDSKTEVYLAPFLCNTTGEAIRSFTEIANDPNSQIGKYPADFTLFEIGSFDDSNAHILHLPTPKSIGLATEFVKSS